MDARQAIRIAGQDQAALQFHPLNHRTEFGDDSRGGSRGSNPADFGCRLRGTRRFTVFLLLLAAVATPADVTVEHASGARRPLKVGVVVEPIHEFSQTVT